MKKRQTDLVEALRKSWTRGTSYSPERWTEKNPAVGQCAVTALIVQEELGGEIVRVAAVMSSECSEEHYYNLVDGEVFDATREQFPSGTEMINEERVSRDYILSFPSTVRRHELLLVRVAQSGEVRR